MNILICVLRFAFFIIIRTIHYYWCEYIIDHSSSSNNNNMTSKRTREDKEEDVSESIPMPSSILIKFARHDGLIAGTTTLEIPSSSTTEQLEILLNSVLENEEKRPYAFFINEEEIASTIQETLQRLQHRSFEESISIVYEPLSLYRVRPITRCIETMFGHTDAVLHVSYSPDGRHLASGGGDSIVRFWNITSSMPLHACKGHRSHVLCSAWAPDSSCFVTADKSGGIRVWNPVTGQQRGKEMHAHTGFITSLSFEPFHLNSRCIRLASSSKDKSVIIWNIATCQAEATLYTHTDSVESVKWGGRGLLYTASRDRTIKVWGSDDESGHFKLVRTLSGHAHRINSLALNTDYVLRTGPFQLGLPPPTLDGDGDGGSARVDAAAAARARYEEVVGTVGEVLVSCSDDFTLIMWKPVEGKLPITRMTGER